MDKKPKIKKRPRPYLVVTVLGVVDLFILVALFYFISNLPEKASEVKKLRTIEQSTQFDAERIVTDLAAVDSKYQELADYLPDDVGLVEFINQLESMKNEGLISNYNVTNQGVIRDKLGYSAVPIVIDIDGSWENINQGLNRFQNLPYLTRVSKVETSVNEEGNRNFRMGIVLYVDEKLN